jgi:hypothetical protein
MGYNQMLRISFGEYGVIFEYLPKKKQKNVAAVADALSCLDIDSLKIQDNKEEELSFPSGSGKTAVSLISNHQSQ